MTLSSSKKNRMKTYLNIFLMFALSATSLFSQFCQQNHRFTWQGDTIGNKAVWNVDDVMNTYLVDGITVNVSLLDPFGVNTTTSNPSEFNDYTKSNAYFGPGSLMLQATSTASNQPLCLKFAFSVPVVVEDFRAFDIDYIARGRTESSFQDSISFYATMNGVNVPLKLDYLSLFPSFTIQGQSAKSKYIVNTNGDIQHTDLKGGVKVSSQNGAINTFTICYANGSMDEGISNSHAVKLLGFDFCSAGIGAASGKVKKLQTGDGIGGSMIQLFDTLGVALLDEMGQPYTALTGPDGLYAFQNIPWGYYQIVQVVEPVGYFSVDDSDGGNDNSIRVLLDAGNPLAINLDFIESASPLPVEFGGMGLKWSDETRVEISWSTLHEVNNDYFTIEFSEDGNNFTSLYKIPSYGNSQQKVDYAAFHEPGGGSEFFYRINQSDLDGRSTVLGIGLIRRNQKQLNYSVFPNPSADYLSVEGSTEDEISVYSIFDGGGKLIKTGWLTPERIPVHDLENGLYYLQIMCAQQQVVLPFQKQ